MIYAFTLNIIHWPRRELIADIRFGIKMLGPNLKDPNRLLYQLQKAIFTEVEIFLLMQLVTIGVRFVFIKILFNLL